MVISRPAPILHVLVTWVRVAETWAISFRAGRGLLVPTPPLAMMACTCFAPAALLPGWAMVVAVAGPCWLRRGCGSEAGS